MDKDNVLELAATKLDKRREEKERAERITTLDA